MRKLLICLPALILVSSCEERAAQFAKKADGLLVEYQKRIDAQIASSTTYYQNAATLSAAERGRVTIESLQAERSERATELEADYREKRRPVSLYRDDLRAYAIVNFAQLKAWLSADADASAPYLQQLVSLERDQATIEAFDKTLKNLAQPRTVKAEIKDLQQFVADSKTEFGKLICEDIEKQLKATPAPRADKIATLESLRKSQSCR